MKKKIIVIIAIVAAVAMLVGIKIIFLNNRKVTYDFKTYQIDKIPTFTLTIGSTNREEPILITKDELINKNINAYEFKGKLDNNWEIVANDYVGIRLIDIFNAYNIGYEDIEFYEVDSYSVKYNKDEINEDMYIVFFKDGNPVGEMEPISMISFKHKWSESLADINYIFIYEEPNNNVPKS